jgi:hypothetical protein
MRWWDSSRLFIQVGVIIELHNNTPAAIQRWDFKLADVATDVIIVTI